VLPIPAIDGAQHTLAEQRCVLDDPVEHRQQISRRVSDEAQDLGCRRLPLPGFLKFEGELAIFDFAELSTFFAGLVTRTAFGALRRFRVIAVRPRDFFGPSPAPERRFIAFP
jgi:hypothetical protein